MAVLLLIFNSWGRACRGRCGADGEAERGGGEDGAAGGGGGEEAVWVVVVGAGAAMVSPSRRDALDYPSRPTAAATPCPAALTIPLLENPTRNRCRRRRPPLPKTPRLTTHAPGTDDAHTGRRCQLGHTTVVYRPRPIIHSHFASQPGPPLHCWLIKAQPHQERRRTTEVLITYSV